MLAIRNFSKSYNGTLILSVKYLDLPRGVYWIKGENGSGKSTLFKSVAGILPFDGEISYKKIPLKTNPVDYRKLVNYAEAEPLFPGFLTAKDLVRFIGKTKGASLQQQNSLSETFGIKTFFEKPCETYSSGMMKKLSLTLAFLGAPEVIILDEPLITLDENARNILINLITELSTKEVTFLLSSHQSLDDGSLKLTSRYSIQNKTLTID